MRGERRGERDGAGASASSIHVRVITCAFALAEEMRTELRAISERSVIDRFHACLAVVYSSS